MDELTLIIVGFLYVREMYSVGLGCKIETLEVKLHLANLVLILHVLLSIAFNFVHLEYSTTLIYLHSIPFHLN